MMIWITQGFPYLYLEDVWLTGLLREKMNIEPVDIIELRAHSNDMILVSQTLQNSHSYVQTFLTSISFRRDNDEYELCHQLEREARRCHLAKCKNNIYHDRTWLSRKDLDRGRMLMSLSDGYTNKTFGEEFYDCAGRNISMYWLCKRQFLRDITNYVHKNVDFLKDN